MHGKSGVDIRADYSVYSRDSAYGKQKEHRFDSYIFYDGRGTRSMLDMTYNPSSLSYATNMRFDLLQFLTPANGLRFSFNTTNGKQTITGVQGIEYDAGGSGLYQSMLNFYRYGGGDSIASIPAMVYDDPTHILSIGSPTSAANEYYHVPKVSIGARKSYTLYNGWTGQQELFG